MNSATSHIQSTGFACIPNDEPVDTKRLLALAGAFGRVLEISKHQVDGPGTQEVSANGLFGSQALPWHNDWSYGRGSYHGTLLYNRKNGHLADTWFCDMEEACASLSESQRARYRTFTGQYQAIDRLAQKHALSRERTFLRRTKARRPLVFSHPITGRDVLYFSPATLVNIADADGAEVEIDVHRLVAHCEKFAWPHHWNPHDVLLYDNLRLMHRRDAFQGERILHRVQFSFDLANRR